MAYFIIERQPRQHATRNTGHAIRKPSWAITEPHLVHELAETFKKCYPSAYVEVLDDIGEVQAFLALEDDAILRDRPRIAVLSKETLRGGSGFEPAVVPDRRRFHGIVMDVERFALFGGFKGNLEAEISVHLRPRYDDHEF